MQISPGTKATPSFRSSQRSEIARQVEEFLKKGGEIEQLPGPQPIIKAVASAWKLSSEYN